MNRIDQIFTNLRKQGRPALMPFITAGYPSVEATAAVLPALQEAGADICELGIPFSDPIADGPVIQASMTEALRRRIHPAQVFDTVRALRPRLNMGLVTMVSYSIVYRIGVQRFIREAAEAGFDGFIFPDLPLEEAASVVEPMREAGLVGSLLIAPTTPDDRAEAIARACTGFIYLVAHTGITGQRDELPPGLTQRVQRLRKVTDLPIAVGFGVSTAQHVRAVTRTADAAIVGSALVREISRHADAPPDQIAEHVGRFVADLAEGCR